MGAVVVGGGCWVLIAGWRVACGVCRVSGALLPDPFLALFPPGCCCGVCWVLGAQAVEVELKRVRAVGVAGWGAVAGLVLGEWGRDIAATQYTRFLQAAWPVSPLWALLLGASQLVTLPIEEYRTHKRLVRGLRRGQCPSPLTPCNIPPSPSLSLLWNTLWSTPGHPCYATPLTIHDPTFLPPLPRPPLCMAPGNPAGASAFLQAVSREALDIGIALSGGAQQVLASAEGLLTPAPLGARVHQGRGPASGGAAAGISGRWGTEGRGPAKWSRDRGKGWGCRRREGTSDLPIGGGSAQGAAGRRRRRRGSAGQGQGVGASPFFGWYKVAGDVGEGVECVYLEADEDEDDDEDSCHRDSARSALGWGPGLTPGQQRGGPGEAAQGAAAVLPGEVGEHTAVYRGPGLGGLCRGRVEYRGLYRGVCRWLARGRWRCRKTRGRGCGRGRR